MNNLELYYLKYKGVFFFLNLAKQQVVFLKMLLFQARTNCEHFSNNLLFWAVPLALPSTSTWGA